MRRTRKIIKIDEELCDGCGACVPACAEGSIKIVGGKARLVAENLCDGLGACLGDCPKGALSVEEREAEAFDEEAVAEHLTCSACHGDAPSLIREAAPRPGVSPGAAGPGSRSNLSHWPVQINLVPASAPFLQEADLLVTADCVPVAYPFFHQDFIDGKVVLLGCPKFDNKTDYLEKFIEIFKNARIKSVTVLDMEVPCCSSLPGIVERAIESAGVSVPIKEVTVSTRGEILNGRPDHGAILHSLSFSP
jgi:NAD-dependent dihydropyrimidine dehydrogenase PreA subunit